MKSLVINADDLGLSGSVNQAIALLYDRRAITGASIMPIGRKFDQAVSMLKDRGIKEIGVHLTFTGRFVSMKGVKLPYGYLTLLSKYFFGRMDIKTIREEIVAQIGKVADQGFELTHIDSHEHVHMLPGILEAVIEASGKFGIPYIRVPSEPGAVLKKCFSIKDLFRYWGLRPCAGRSYRAVSGKGLISCAGFLGHFHSGRISKDILIFLADIIGEGETELAVHPGIMSDELLGSSPWHRNSQNEMEALLSYEWKEKLISRGIATVTHKQVAEMRTNK